MKQNNYSLSSVTKDLNICFLSYRVRRRSALIFHFNADKKMLNTLLWLKQDFDIFALYLYNSSFSFYILKYGPNTHLALLSSFAQMSLRPLVDVVILSCVCVSLWINCFIFETFPSLSSAWNPAPPHNSHSIFTQKTVGLELLYRVDSNCCSNGWGVFLLNNRHEPSVLKPLFRLLMHSEVIQVDWNCLFDGTPSCKVFFLCYYNI